MDDTTWNPESTQFVNIEDLRKPATPEQEHRRAALLVLAGWEIGQEIQLTEDSIIIGRAQDIEVTINQASVSRRHAQIERVREEGVEAFQLTDMGSSNGTLINGVRQEKAFLRDGDKVQLGDVLFKFVVQDAYDAQYHQHIHRLIHFDQLTGLMTMESFRRYLDDWISRAEPGARMALSMTDLDGLKRVNDTYGHLAGRMVVREMGVMLRESIREQDRAGLYGGDEAIIIYPATALADAVLVAEKIRTTVAERMFTFRDQAFQVSISQGVAEWPIHGHTAEEIIAAADAALYAAKQDGRNCTRTAGA